MARIRTIKPEFWEDEKIGRLPIPCRLFFIGCWNFADDFGCIKGNAALLKSQIFPYDENLRVSEVKKWIDALVDARMLIPIIHAEESYYYIRTFRSHQIIDKRYDKSYIGKEIITDLINNALREHHVDTTLTHSEHHVDTQEEKEKEKEKEKVILKTIPDFIDKDLFNDFLEMRKKKRVPLTDKALKLLINRLTEFHNSGQNVSKIIENSIMRGWTGVFEEKTEPAKKVKSKGAWS